MLWKVHATVFTSPTVASDKYNDNHYAVDLRGGSFDYISTYFTNNYAKAFPINYPATQFAWDCDQDYVIDPTGYAIQMDVSFTTDYPGCEDVVRAFLEDHPDFRPAAEEGLDALGSERTSPCDGMDGFYLAVFEREAPAS